MESGGQEGSSTKAVTVTSLVKTVSEWGVDHSELSLLSYYCWSILHPPVGVKPHGESVINYQPWLLNQISFISSSTSPQETTRSQPARLPCRSLERSSPAFFKAFQATNYWLAHREWRNGALHGYHGDILFRHSLLRASQTKQTEKKLILVKLNAKIKHL